MLLLAHVGITLGASCCLVRFWKWRGLENYANAVDYRLVLLGAVLPDIIDKPLGGLILRESLGNGRIYSHTLAFLLVLFTAGVILQRKLNRPGLLVIGGGVAAHYVLDGMWFSPANLFWPLYGWSFPKGNPEGWMQLWLNNLLSNPLVFVPEIAGGLILLCFLVKFYGKGEKKTVQHNN
ncbi:MAG: metal-dependent hydrolase [Firmicutes bacterium]|nr:metal-dependent hydrolase [Bacillota bacterium]